MNKYLVFVEEKKKQIQDSVKNKSEKQLEYCMDLLELATKQSDDLNIGYAYVWIADYYFYTVFDMENTSKNLELAYPHIILSKDYELLINYYRLKGLEDEALGNYVDKVKCYLEILAIMKKTGIDDYYAICYGNIAISFQQSQDYEEGLKYCRMSEAYFKTKEDRYVNIQYLILQNNIGDNLYHLKNIEDLEKCIEEIRKINDEVGLKKQILALTLLRYNSLIKNEERVEASIKELYDSEIFNHSNIILKLEFLERMLECAINIKSETLCIQLLEKIDKIIPQKNQNIDINLQLNKVKYSLLFDEKSVDQRYKDFYENYKMISRNRNDSTINAINNIQAISKINARQKEIEEANESLRTEAILDGLTGLYNRRYLNEVRKIITENNISEIGMAIIDVDYFKEYNDFYGHVKGDEVLVTIATIMKNKSTDKIIPCRYGGDEYFVIFFDKTSDEINNWLQNISSILESENVEHLYSKCSDHITLSMGFDVRTVAENLNYMDIFEKADIAVYFSKRSGRNQIMQYSKGRK